METILNTHHFITCCVHLHIDTNSISIYTPNTYQGRVARYYNARVKNRCFRVGDLVLKKVLPNTQDPGVGNLGPNWEGPYIMKDVVGPGTYSLYTIHGNILRHAWNVEHLRVYYQ